MRMLALVLVATSLAANGTLSALGSEFHQCANDGNAGHGACEWVGGVLGASKTDYYEGMSTPQRLLFTNIPATPGDVHVLTFDHSTTQSGVHTYDFLTRINQGNNPSITLNMCADYQSAYQTICAQLYSTTPFAVNLFDDDFISQHGPTRDRIIAYETLNGDRELHIRGNAPINSANIVLEHVESNGQIVPNYGDTDNTKIRYTLTYVSSATNILITFGGHLALSGTGADAWGPVNGASYGAGASYHITMDRLDASTIGHLDNQIQSNAIQPLTPPAVCDNDGIPEPGEECDEGPYNGPCPATCSATCTLNNCGVPICGDGILGNTLGEECDDGNVVDGDGCSSTCQNEGAAYCGDEIPQEPNDGGFYERCDDGAANGVCPATCSATCTLNNCPVPACGDGISGNTPGEECDDHNNANLDGCSSTCQNEGAAVCGDTIPQTPNDAGVYEQCDAGTSNGMVCTPAYASACTYCDSNCQNAVLQGGFCGDGTPQAPEQCDDANSDDADGCTSQCTFGGIPNPELNPACDLDIVLIMDSSDSIDATELSQMKQAFQQFVDAFIPLTPTQMAVVDFDTTARIVQTYTADHAQLTAAINAPTSNTGPPVGYTNWQDALYDAHAMFDNRPGVPDLYIFASDGEPNRWSDPAIATTQIDAVQKAIVEADQIKSDGVRIVALGIGLSPTNLQYLTAIADANSVVDTNFNELAQELVALAQKICSAQLQIVKLEQGAPGPNWGYSIETSDGTSGTRSTDAAGQWYELLSVEDEILSINISEIVQPGMQVTSAVCEEDGQPRGAFDGVDTITGATIAPGELLVCTFENNPILPAPSCIIPYQHLLLIDGQSQNIPLSAVFSTPTGSFTGYTATAQPPAGVIATTSATDVSITSQSFVGSGVVDVTLTGTGSVTCPVSVLRLPNACNSAACYACSDLACLQSKSNNCLETGTVYVTNPFVSVTPANYLPLPWSALYTVNSFSTLDARFTVNPTSGTVLDYFDVASSSAQHGEQTAGIIDISLEDYTGRAQICLELERVFQQVGNATQDPGTDFLSTSSRSIVHTFEEGSNVIIAGPFIFTAKVWVR